jgi:cytochrome c553
MAAALFFEARGRYSSAGPGAGFLLVGWLHSRSNPVTLSPRRFAMHTIRRRARLGLSRAGLMSLFGLALVIAALLSACQAQKPASDSSGDMSAAATMSPVERGKYLVTGMGCNDCHTPWKMGANGPEPDMTRLLSGHPADEKLGPPPAMEGGWLIGGSASMTAWAGPWGISYSANLTPDEATGIGSWTEDTFIQTVRNGKHMGTGRAILPPMPWMWLKTLNDADLKAISAYLHSIPAIPNQVPDPVPPAGGMGAPSGGE